MIDSVKLTLDRFEVRKSNGLTVSRNYVNGEEQDLRCLFPIVGGGVEHGAKAYLNNEQFNFTVKRLGTDKPGASVINASVQFSAPKVVGGNNFIPADEKCFDSALDIVEEKMYDAGIETNIREGRLQRVDVTRNAILENPVSDYSTVFELLHGGRMKQRRLYPSGFLISNSAREVCFYDKRLEMIHKKVEVENVPPNVLRAEVRCLDTKTSERMFEIRTAGELSKHFDRVPDIYQEVVADVFKHDAVNLQTLAMTQLERVFRAEQGRQSNARWISRSIQIIGANYICFSLGTEDVLRKMFYNLGLRKQHVFHYVKKIMELKRDYITQGTLFGSNTTVGELYDELKFKLVA